MKRLPFLLILSVLSTFACGSSAAVGPVKKIVCTGIRDEPGAPTFSFELIRQSNQLYQARYLSLPGNESAPPEVVANILDLKCRFYPKNRFYLQCQKLGASVESIWINESKLRLIDDHIQNDGSREFRAVGVDVTNGYQALRFGHADRCTLFY